MHTDSVFTTLIAASFLLFISAIVAFFGTRLFWIILPIWGFFAGMAIGAQGVQALFGDGFLSTAFSWIAAFFLGLIFALMSYLFWYLAVALVGGYVGYGVIVGFFGLFGVELGPVVWILGFVVGVVFAIVTMVLNIQKYVVVIGTSLLGAAGIVGTFLTLFQDITPAQLGDHPLKVVTDAGFGWSLLLAVIAVLAIAFQAATTRRYELSEYDRWAEYSETTPQT
jgi:hypothetical protein